MHQQTLRGTAAQAAVVVAAVFFILPGGVVQAQQTASTVEPPRSVDRDFRPIIEDPTYPSGSGPLVLVDETHNNFHTSVGTYWPFADVLRKDGYRVERATAVLTREILESCQVLVISDAQPPPTAGDPPTFSRTEVDLLNRWVSEGGSLFLITDHMPDPAAIAGLALTFGIEIHDGYVLNGPPPGIPEPILFQRSDGTLTDHPLTNGRDPSDRVSSVATFNGSAFRADERFQPIMILGQGRRSWAPEELYEFKRNTPNLDVSGWLQGGVMEYGEGRLAFFTEAAMFTAQAFDNGNVRFGMNHPQGVENLRLLRNVMRWLSRGA